MLGLNGLSYLFKLEADAQTPELVVPLSRGCKRRLTCAVQANQQIILALVLLFSLQAAALRLDLTEQQAKLVALSR